MDVTIYTYTDVYILGLIFNGIAAWCSSSNSFFEIALLASMVHLFRYGPSVVLMASQNAARQAIAGVTISLALAMLLTSPGFKSKVTLENQLTGQVTQVSNVPIIISMIPAAASVLANNLGSQMETVFGGASAEYGAISVGGAGFINPLKMLLQARGLINRAGMQSNINAVTSSCLAMDANIDFLNAGQLISNAGAMNGQTAATTSTVLTVNQNTSSPTAIGALLYQASLNTSGTVPSLNIPGTDIASCPQAAAYVGNQLSNFFDSVDFNAALKGSTNAMDAPAPTNAGTYAAMALAYQATANLNNNLGNNQSTVQGVSQANAEMTNMIMSQVVEDNLGCLQTFGSQKAACLAEKGQAAAIEQGNIDNAASANAMLSYMGQFADMMLSLIVGLGPVIVIFMMFAGVSSGKNLKVAVHMIVWPLLVYNVGAVLVNGIIYNQVSAMLQDLRAASGMLTQAQTWNAYRAISMKVGAASSIMAAIPVLMTSIFALGESAAAVSIAGTMSGKDRFQEKDVAAPITNNKNAQLLVSPGDKAEVGTSGSLYKAMGSIDSTTLSGQADSAQTASRGIAQQIQKAHMIEQGSNVAQEFAHAIQSGKVNDVVHDDAITQAVQTSFTKNKSALEEQTKGMTTSQVKALANQTTVGGSASASAGAGAGAGGSISTDQTTSTTNKAPGNKGPEQPKQVSGSSASTKGDVHAGANADAKVSVDAQTTTQAKNSKDVKTDQAEREKAINSMAAAMAYSENKTAIDKATEGQKSGDTWSSNTKAMDSYANSLKKTESTADMYSNAHTAGAKVISQMAPLSDTQIANQLKGANPTFGRMVNSSAFTAANFSEPVAQEKFEQYRQQLNEGMKSGQYSDASPGTRDAIARVGAMDRMARDSSVSDKTAAEALGSVLGAYGSMTNTNLGVDPSRPQDLGLKIKDPTNSSGVNAGEFKTLAAKKSAETPTNTITPNVTDALKPVADYVNQAQQVIAQTPELKGGPGTLATKEAEINKSVKVAADDANKTLSGGTAARAGGAVIQNADDATSWLTGRDTQDPTEIQKPVTKK